MKGLRSLFPNYSMELENKAIVITGASSGLGKQLALDLAMKGNKLALLARNEKELEKVKKECEKSGAIVKTFVCDVSRHEEVKKTAKFILEDFGKIDILINNAGVLLDENETRVIPDKLRQTLEINLIGTIDFTEKIIPLMNKGGHIMNISSTAGSLELSGDSKSHHPDHYPSYKISKAALNMYTRTLSPILKKDKITVSSVHPGWVRTDMGGNEAPISPEEAADGIYKIAASNTETGQFWFRDKKLPW